jgi:thymidylate kinase
LANRLAEEWFRQGLAWYYERRGYVVVFDRHFFSDYYAHDISATSGSLPLSRRIHGFVLDRLYPKPDLVILLDAPANILFARKGEGTIALLERRRQEYLSLRDRLEDFAIVDASQPAEEVIRQVTDLIRGFMRRREQHHHG